jgi:fructose-bisphosphate aldolase class II
MPVADYATYCAMLDNAKRNRFAYPAINTTSMATINATLAAFAEAKCDGIIQVSTGGGKFAGGLALGDEVLGAIALAQFIHLVADRYDVFVAVHSDHCPPAKVDSFLRPLIAETARRRAEGQPNLFSSHMFDGAVLPLDENMATATELLELCKENELILEVEAGVVGGEEDGVDHSGVGREKLYSTPEDMLGVAEALNPIGHRYLFAATFGNVHGVYKPGNVKLRPEVLKEGQDVVVAKHGAEASFDFVFHGGSGSTLDEIHAAIEYGVVKMNIDTDTQYAFTRPIVEHMMKNYDGVLKVDGEVGQKKAYDPRTYLKKAETGMKERVLGAISDLKTAGTSLRA